MPKHTGEESEDEDEQDDEKGIVASVEYICTLIDREISEAKVPLDRIVVGGFSQGCAISMLVGLMCRYRGKLGGVVGLSGYLPLAKKVESVARERAKIGDSQTKWFLAHGTRDKLVPMRMFRAYQEKLEAWEAGNVEAKVYEGMPHSTTGAEVRDLCTWLRRFYHSRQGEPNGPFIDSCRLCF